MTTTDTDTLSAQDAPEFAPAQFVRWFREVAPYVGVSYERSYGGTAPENLGDGLRNARAVPFAQLLALEERLLLKLDIPTDLEHHLIPSLIIMMIVKFAIVVGYFMHLRFDLAILNGKLFSWAFFSSLALAVGVYAAVIVRLGSMPGVPGKLIEP